MIQKIHFVGIKGVGMTPLAIIAKEAGFVVTGSDSPQTFITDVLLKKYNITVDEGFDPSRVANVDMVVTTGAHGGYDNPEVKAAKEKGIQVLTQGQAVGYFMSGELFNNENMTGISITGCHGKTTTTALVATLLKEAGKDPSFVIGTGEIPSLQTSGHFGKGDYFVAEADEYATEPTHDRTPKFMWQHPQIAIMTNVEYDHPDLYPSLEAVIEAYTAFAKQLTENNSLLIACGDDNNIKKILETYNGELLTYGFNSDNNYVLKNIHTSSEGLHFTLQTPRQEEEDYILSVLGEHNALNAVAAIIVAKQCGLSPSDIQKGLSAFTGTKRRLEYIGTIPSGALLYDDYAHHPTEIKAALKALKDKYPDKKLIAVFQPHTYTRTIKLFEQFVDSFKAADELVLADIYASARETVDPNVSSEKLAHAISMQHEAVLWLPTLQDVVQYLKQKNYAEDCIVVTMGAGDIYTIHHQLLSK